MVELKDLYPGCKVRIVDQWGPGCDQSDDGLMDRWLGQTMTVDYIGTNLSGRPCAFMCEDVGDGPSLQGDRWYWFPEAIAEIITGNDKQEKPRICDILGVEVGEPFSIDGYPTDYGMVQVCEDGKIRRVISSVEFPFAQDGEVGHKIGANALYYLLNHPDCLVRKPRWTEQEVEMAKAIKVLFPCAIEIAKAPFGSVFVSGASLTLGTEYFPSIQPGKSVKLDDIIK